MAEETTPESTAVKISTEGAEQFVEAYYTALQSSRHTIANYYVNLHTLPDGKIVPNINYNGNSLEDGPAVQSMFEYDMPFTHYDVQALNCQVLNPTQVQPAPTKPKEIERNMSILVFVSGNVRLEEPTKGPLKGFSETLILVPSVDEVAGDLWSETPGGDITRQYGALVNCYTQYDLEANEKQLQRTHIRGLEARIKFWSASGIVQLYSHTTSRKTTCAHAPRCFVRPGKSPF